MLELENLRTPQHYPDCCPMDLSLPVPCMGTLYHGITTEMSSQHILICLHSISVNHGKQIRAGREDVSQKVFKSSSLRVFGQYKCFNKAD